MLGCSDDDASSMTSFGTGGASTGAQTSTDSTGGPTSGSTDSEGTTDASAEGSADDTGTTSSAGTDTTSGGDTDGTGSTGQSLTTGPSTTGTTGGEVCETVICGAAEVCCGADEDCVLGQCLPACDSGIRCGEAQDICCDAGQVCLSDACVDPIGSCQDSFDCELGQFCEPTLEQCLPQFDPVSCEVIPDFNDIAVVQEWSYTDEEVISMPAVADVDGDGLPEVVLNLAHLGQGNDWPIGAIAILDGQTGEVQLELDHDPLNGEWGSHGRSTIGVSDVSGDAIPDIVYASRPVFGGDSAIVATTGDGTFLWTSHDPDDTIHTFDVENGAISFGNFDDDDQSEVVVGASLIDHDGTVVWDQAGDGASFGSNGTYRGGISAVVDLTGDGYPEIVSGRHAWSVDWQVVGGEPQVNVTMLWDAGAPDGYPAVADVDLDGNPEVILVGSGTVRILEGETGELWCGLDPTEALCNLNPALRTQPVAIPAGGRGGPPTVADFDGDGRPEIAAAGGGSYTVYDLYRNGEDVVVANGFPDPALGEIYPRWTQTTQDQSSNATGSSVFDFQGDGVAEVVYADECYMRIYSGLDGSVILEIESSNATIHEYPLVVDVDADGNSEILVTANDTNSGNNCGDIPGYTPRRGLYVYGDEFDQWVGTRRVWTSHTYHVTNVNSAGNYPVQENDNWTTPGLNNYRQNVQGEGVFNAPDLSVDLNAELAACAMMQLEVVATVRNQGALGVPAGLEVSLYEGVDANGILIGTQMTTDPLLPGAQTEVSWLIPFNPGDPALDLFVTVDGSPGVGSVLECDETNNDAADEGAECLFPG